MTVKLQKWGNSQGIRIPKIMLDELNIKENDELNVTSDGDKIIIKKSSSRKNIVGLFDGFDGEYNNLIYDWGDPVGEELW